MSTKDERLDTYMQAYQDLGRTLSDLPELNEAVDKATGYNEWFALNAAHHGILAAMDALAVLEHMLGTGWGE